MRAVTGSIVLILVAGCGPATPNPVNESVPSAVETIESPGTFKGAEPTVRADGSDEVAFATSILPQANRNGRTIDTLLCTYTKGQIKETFRLEMSIADDASGHSMTGALMREGKKRCPNFLGALARLHKVKVPTKIPQHKDRLDFEMIVLANKLRRGDKAGFVPDPFGTWSLSKALVGNDKGEFFLNLNATENRGTIGLNDPDNGAYLLDQFVSVLG